MPLLMQNRFERAYRDVPKPGPGMRVALEDYEGKNQQEKGISAIFLQPYPGVLLLPVTVAAAIARAQKLAASSTAERDAFSCIITL